MAGIGFTKGAATGIAVGAEAYGAPAAGVFVACDDGVIEFMLAIEGIAYRSVIGATACVGY